MAEPMPRRRRWAHNEDGSAIAELVIVAPILLIVVVLMVALGRVDSAQGDVESAARCRCAGRGGRTGCL